MLHLSPLVVSQSQLSVCCVARRAAGDSSLVVELRGKDEHRGPGGGRGGLDRRHQNSGVLRQHSALLDNVMACAYFSFLGGRSHYLRLASARCFRM